MPAPDSPVYGETFRTEPDDGVRYTYKPDSYDDGVPWRAEYPDGHPHAPAGHRRGEWLADDELPEHLVPADDETP